MADQTFVGLLAPYSQGSEEATLGSCLVDPGAFGGIAAILRPEDFFILRHSYIFDAMDRLFKRGDIIDFVSVQDELESVGRLNDVGGPGYLIHLVNQTASTYHVETYARMVERTARRRRYLTFADETKALALDEQLSLEKVTTDIDSRWLLAQRTSDATYARVQNALGRHFERTESAFKNPRATLGIQSSIPDMNNILRGYQAGKLYVPAGRPGMGKSSWMLTEAGDAADGGARVLFASLEMPEEEVMDNLIAQQSQIPIENIQTGLLTDSQWSKYVEMTGKMGNWRMTICDQAGLTPLELRAMARKIAAQDGLDMIFLDYIQLMSGGREQRYDNRDQEIGYISRSLKALAKELRIPVIAAAQLSREVEKRQDKHPMLSDLRESGNIENDADVVMFFYREDYYTKPEPPNVVSPTEVSIAKHRGGRTGMIAAGFHGEIKRFVPMARIDLGNL